MAEIKSTMEMVLARAANLGETAPAATDETALHTGMRMAADFMAGNSDTPLAGIETHPAEAQETIRKGAVQVLLRNIVPPRNNDVRAGSERALQALQSMGLSPQSAMAMEELAQIINQYSQHQEQALQQLDNAIRSQLQQQAMARGLEVNPEELNPVMHPQYKEELTKLRSELNGQYNNAMDERKAIISGDCGLS